MQYSIRAKQDALDYPLEYSAIANAICEKCKERYFSWTSLDYTLYNSLLNAVRSLIDTGVNLYYFPES